MSLDVRLLCASAPLSLQLLLELQRGGLPGCSGLPLPAPLPWLLLPAHHSTLRHVMSREKFRWTAPFSNPPVCSDRILTCRIKSIRSPAKVGLVVTDLITSPVVSWEGWETPPQHRGSAVILCSTTGVVRPLCSCGDLLLSSARLVYVLVDVDWNTFSCG